MVEDDLRLIILRLLLFKKLARGALLELRAKRMPFVMRGNIKDF